MGFTGRDWYHLVDLVESYTVVCVTFKKVNTLTLPGLVVGPKADFQENSKGGTHDAG